MKIAVISGKGGSGKSSVTAALIDMSERVVAVDCDVDASNLPLLFQHRVVEQEPFASGMRIVVDEESCTGCGICVDHCAFDALKMDNGVVRTKDFMCEGCRLCVRLCPQNALQMVPETNSMICVSTFNKGLMVHGRLCPGDDNSGKMIARLRQLADVRMEEQKIGLQILDGPPGIGCPALSTVTGVDTVVIVSEPTLSGISDLRRAYHVAHSFCKNIFVIINKCDVNVENRKEIISLCNSCGVPVIAELPFDRRMVEAQIHCKSIVEYAPNSGCAEALKKACQYIFVENR